MGAGRDGGAVQRARMPDPRAEGRTAGRGHHVPGTERRGEGCRLLLHRRGDKSKNPVMAGPGGPAFLIEWISHADFVQTLCKFIELFVRIE